MATSCEPGHEATRAPGLGRISGHQFGQDCLDYLVYRYLVPCISRAGSRARGRLVDIGCGNTPYRDLFPHVDAYVGCDVAQSSDNRVSVVCRADAIAFREQSFDVALCTQTIEHVANYPGLLREAHRLLRPGGTLHVSGPMYWYLHEEPYDFYRFTKYGFTAALEDAGFIVDEVEPNGGKWSVLGLVFLHTIPRRFKRPVFIRVINRLFVWLDKRQYDPISTSNYFVTAHRALP